MCHRRFHLRAPRPWSAEHVTPPIAHPDAAQGNDTSAMHWSRCERRAGSDFGLLQQYPPTPPDMTPAKPKLLDHVKGRMRARHLSPRTERAYVGWIMRYIRYHGMRHPIDLGEAEIVAYLT